MCFALMIFWHILQATEINKEIKIYLFYFSFAFVKKFTGIMHKAGRIKVREKRVCGGWLLVWIDLPKKTLSPSNIWKHWKDTSWQPISAVNIYKSTAALCPVLNINKNKQCSMEIKTLKEINKEIKWNSKHKCYHLSCETLYMKQEHRHI